MLLAEKIGKFNQRASEHLEKQSLNPFSGRFKRSPSPRLSKDEYGKPVPGSKTEERGQRARSHINKEILELCNTIHDIGSYNLEQRRKEPDFDSAEDDGTIIVTFGELFQIYTKINDKVVGLLIAAKKRGFVYFEKEILFQRRDDDVMIALIKPINEIRAIMREALSPSPMPSRTPSPGPSDRRSEEREVQAEAKEVQAETKQEEVQVEEKEVQAKQEEAQVEEKEVQAKQEEVHEEAKEVQEETKEVQEEAKEVQEETKEVQEERKDVVEAKEVQEEAKDVQEEVKEVGIEVEVEPKEAVEVDADSRHEEQQPKPEITVTEAEPDTPSEQSAQEEDLGQSCPIRLEITDSDAVQSSEGLETEETPLEAVEACGGDDPVMEIEGLDRGDPVLSVKPLEGGDEEGGQEPSGETRQESEAVEAGAGDGSEAGDVASEAVEPTSQEADGEDAPEAKEDGAHVSQAETCAESTDANPDTPQPINEESPLGPCPLRVQGEVAAPESADGSTHSEQGESG